MVLSKDFLWDLMVFHKDFLWDFMGFIADFRIEWDARRNHQVLVVWQSKHDDLIHLYITYIIFYSVYIYIAAGTY